jgi:hypothetical protein
MGTLKLIGAMVYILGVLFGVLFWSFNGIFYSIISSISSNFVLKIFNVVNNGIFYSKYHQFPKINSNSTILSIQLRSIKD